MPVGLHGKTAEEMCVHILCDVRIEYTLSYAHTLMIAPHELDSLHWAPSRIAEKNRVKTDQDHSTYYEERGLC